MEIKSAVGLVQLERLNSFLKLRNNNAKIFQNLFENKNWCQIQIQEKNSISSWYGFNLVLKGQLENQREKIIKKLLKNNIEIRPTMTGNFLNNPVIKYLNHMAKGTFKNAEIVDKNGFFVGNYPKDLSKQLNILYKLIEEEIY